MGLRPEEMRALHEILHWGRVPGHNPILRFYGNTFEDFSDACRALFAQFKHVLPKGNNRVKVRITGKDQLKGKEKELGSTLGDESTGMVVSMHWSTRCRFRGACTRSRQIFFGEAG